MQNEITRTLLVSNMQDTSADEVLQKCRECGDVKEHYFLHKKTSVIFITFYDLRSASKAKDLISREIKGVSAMYSIARCEVPKGSDICTEEANQGTISYISGEDHTEKIQSQICDRKKRNNENIITFYDSRDAIEFLKTIQSTYPRAEARFCWDNDLRKRRNMWLTAENIVKTAPIIAFKSSGVKEEAVKRSFGAGEPRKKIKSTVNWMLSLFDKYIADNSAEIANTVSY